MHKYYNCTYRSDILCVDGTSIRYTVYEVSLCIFIYTVLCLCVCRCARIFTRVDVYECGGIACLLCVCVRHSGQLAHTQRHCHARSQVRHSVDGFREVWSQHSSVLPCTARYRQPGLTAHGICELHLFPNTRPHKQNIYKDIYPSPDAHIHTGEKKHRHIH